jgi:hypothetical protein
MTGSYWGKTQYMKQGLPPFGVLRVVVQTAHWLEVEQGRKRRPKCPGRHVCAAYALLMMQTLLFARL